MLVRFPFCEYCFIIKGLVIAVIVVLVYEFYMAYFELSLTATIWEAILFIFIFLLHLSTQTTFYLFVSIYGKFTREIKKGLTAVGS